MVRIEDITEESERSRAKFIFILNLARSTFDNVYSIIPNENFTTLKVTGNHERKISRIDLSNNQLFLFDKSYLERARKFAEEYSKEFNLTEEFVIKTDYSSFPYPYNCQLPK